MAPLRHIPALLLLLAAAWPAQARQPSGASEPGGRIVVAVREAPPFAMRDAAGRWQGLSVALWQKVAQRLELDFDWREMPLTESLEALEAGSVDVVVTALTITAEREEDVDFSHPYLVSGLTLAYPARGEAWLDTVRSLFSRGFLQTVLSLSLLLLAVGIAVWLFEHRKNPAEFGGSTLEGLGSGFWWSAVTMTTVGYGDKAPRTLGGRLVGLVWMFASLIVIASFTAAITASVTVNQLGGDWLRGRALEELMLGVVAESASADFADARGLRMRGFPSLSDAVRAMDQGRVDVVLHDEPILRHVQRTEEGPEIELAGRALVRHDYGFGLRPGSELREPVNGTLLALLQEPGWQSIRRRYLGAQED